MAHADLITEAPNTAPSNFAQYLKRNLTFTYMTTCIDNFVTYQLQMPTRIACFMLLNSQLTLG